MRKTLILTALCSALLLTGCGANKEYLSIEVANLPESTLHCLPAPYKGKKFIKVNQKQVAYLLAGYKTSHADCESKLATVRRIYAKWKKHAKAVK